MTLTGLVIIPLTLILMIGDWARLIVFMTIVSGLFADAAVINFSSFGIQPGYWVLLALLSRAAIELIVRHEPIRRDVLVRFLPMLILIAASVVALFVASSFYDGTIVVQSSRDGQNGTGSLFHFRLENYAQHFYVILNTLGAMVIAHKISQMPPEMVRRLVGQALHGFIIVGSAIVLWQWLHYTFGIYFPDKDFFHNNAAYAEAYGQNLSDFGYRLCGSFSEPSALAYFFAGALLFAHRQYEIDRSTIALISTFLSIFLLFISTSTSAYFILVLFFLRLAFRQAPVLGRLIAQGTAALATRPSHALFILGAILGVAVFIATHQDLVFFVVKTFIVDKPSTDSFSVRSAADGLAMKVAIQTWGVGLGLGSHKANTLPMTLLSNTGIIGLLAFGWFVIGCFQYTQAACRRTPALASMVKPTQWFLAGLLIQHCFMNPNFNMAMFWAVAGILIGAASVGAPVPAEVPECLPVRFDRDFPPLPHPTV
ncbi:MAG TPA: hypothetical protein VNT30_10055 [Stellaceae bacterium]|nr:hypothetical protein [Stellaceae bacterium]